MDNNKNQEIVTLKEHFQKMFEASDRAINAALAASEKAVLKAEAASEKRFESVNEFRQTLSDQQRNLMPRVESELVTKNLTDRIKTLEEERIKRAGESGGAKNLWLIIVGIASFVLVILSIIFRFIV